MELPVRFAFCSSMRNTESQILQLDFLVVMPFVVVLAVHQSFCFPIFVDTQEPSKESFLKAVFAKCTPLLAVAL